MLIFVMSSFSRILLDLISYRLVFLFDIMVRLF